jgi:hypothetical protein
MVQPQPAVVVAYRTSATILGAVLLAEGPLSSGIAVTAFGVGEVGTPTAGSLAAAPLTIGRFSWLVASGMPQSGPCRCWQTGVGGGHAATVTASRAPAVRPTVVGQPGATGRGPS